MSPDLTVPVLGLRARTTAWASARLVAACRRLTAARFAAPRTSVFPPIPATWEHLHGVDRFDVDALEGGAPGARMWGDEPAFPDAAALAPAQAALAARPIALCDALPAGSAARPLRLDRGAKGMVEERADLVPWHLFQNQIHHRGQIPAKLAGTPVPPPPLDEVVLPSEGNPMNPEARP
jgi:uncharacterized damage-inducible protein DinB